MGLTIHERETHLNMPADDRSTWIVYTDDPVMIRRLNKIATAESASGEGFYYRLHKSQVTLRKKRVLTDAHRAKLRANALRLNKSRETEGLEPQRAIQPAQPEPEAEPS